MRTVDEPRLTFCGTAAHLTICGQLPTSPSLPHTPPHAPLLAQGIAVGQPIGITVEDAKDVAAFANYSPPAAAAAAAPAALAAAPAPVAAAPAPAAPVAPRPAAVAAPVAAPAPAAAAPAPKPVAAAAAASASDSYTPLAFEAWGASLARAPMGQAIAKQQAAYVAAFGWGGYDAMPVAEEKRKGK